MTKWASMSLEERREVVKAAEADGESAAQIAARMGLKNHQPIFATAQMHGAKLGKGHRVVPPRATTSRAEMTAKPGTCPWRLRDLDNVIVGPCGETVPQGERFCDEHTAESQKRQFARSRAI